MAITTTTEVDPAVSTFYDRVLLERALPFLVHEQFAQVRNIPSRSGNTIKFRRYTALTTATTPLSEGVTPAGQQLAKTDLAATVSFYGDFVHISDVVDLTVEDAVLTEASELLGEQMGETRDELMKDVLAATASATNASNGVNAQTPTEITEADIKAIVKTLLGNKAKMITSVMTASTGQGTTPVRSSFWGIAHTDLINDLEDVTNFLHTSKYPTQATILEAEWGATGNVRWLVSTNAHKLASASPDTYECQIIGKNAYATTSIEGGVAKNIVKAFGSGGTSDPLNQRATSGWKVPWVARILNDNFMHTLGVTNAAASG